MQRIYSILDPPRENRPFGNICTPMDATIVHSTLPPLTTRTNKGKAPRLRESSSAPALAVHRTTMKRAVETTHRVGARSATPSAKPSKYDGVPSEAPTSFSRTKRLASSKHTSRRNGPQMSCNDCLQAPMAVTCSPLKSQTPVSRAVTFQTPQRKQATASRTISTTPLDPVIPHEGRTSFFGSPHFYPDKAVPAPENRHQSSARSHSASFFQRADAWISVANDPVGPPQPAAPSGPSRGRQDYGARDRQSTFDIRKQIRQNAVMLNTVPGDIEIYTAKYADRNEDGTFKGYTRDRDTYQHESDGRDEGDGVANGDKYEDPAVVTKASNAAVFSSDARLAPSKTFHDGPRTIRPVPSPSVPASANLDTKEGLDSPIPSPPSSPNSTGSVTSSIAYAGYWYAMIVVLPVKCSRRLILLKGDACESTIEALENLLEKTELYVDLARKEEQARLGSRRCGVM